MRHLHRHVHYHEHTHTHTHTHTAVCFHSIPHKLSCCHSFSVERQLSSAENNPNNWAISCCLSDVQVFLLAGWKSVCFLSMGFDSFSELDWLVRHDSDWQPAFCCLTTCSVCVCVSVCGDLNLKFFKHDDVRSSSSDTELNVTWKMKS